MKSISAALAAACALASTGAGAQTVSNSSLQTLNGTVGTVNAVVTTATATGTRTTVIGTDNTSAGRASGTPIINSWVQSNVGNGSTVGITTDYALSGNGSAYFSSTLGNPGKADLINYIGAVASPTNPLLSTLTGASFDFYRDPSSTTGAQFAPVLRLDIAKDNKFAGSLVFESFYQNQTNPVVGQWNSLSSSLTNGIWWATNGALGPTFAAADGGQKTLQAWIDGNGGSSLSVFGVELGIGSGWNGTFTGAADNVNVAFSDGHTIAANFEVGGSAAAVPEPAAWAMMILGIGAIGMVFRRKVRKSDERLDAKIKRITAGGFA